MAYPTTNNNANTTRNTSAPQASSSRSTTPERRNRPRLTNQYPKTSVEHSFDNSCSDLSYNSDTSTSSSSSSYSSTGSVFSHSYKKCALPHNSLFLAMDCEMVGSMMGESLCARVVLVDWKGRSVFDSYVAPPASETIADYRTFVSGIKKEDLVGAPSFETVQKQVIALLVGKILVGHTLVNDLECLQIQHPWHMIRDTAAYAPFQRRQGELMLPRKLKDLVFEKLGGQVIQQPGQAHCPAEDATAALNLYKQHRPRWEACVNNTVQKKIQQQQRHERQQQQNRLVLARQLHYYQQQQQFMTHLQQQHYAQYHPAVSAMGTTATY